MQLKWPQHFQLHFPFRFDRDNSSLKNELSKSCGNLDIQDSSSEGEEGYMYDDVAGNRLSTYLGPDNSVSFGSISDIKSKWEEEKSGSHFNRREELAKQRKEELKILRARQCQVCVFFLCRENLGNHQLMYLSSFRVGNFV